MKTPKQTPKEIRKRSGRSRAWVAAMAGVSDPTARLYEIAPENVEDERKRAALAGVYGSLAAGGPAAA